jgi:hypothetical protein
MSQKYDVFDPEEGVCRNSVVIIGKYYHSTFLQKIAGGDGEFLNKYSGSKNI